MGKQVLILAGGGTAHLAGGVGTMLLYLQDEWRQQDVRREQPDPRTPALQVRIVDTRGTGGIAAFPWRLASAAAALLASRFRGELALVHAHMTTRGSVLRKGILCSLAAMLRVPVIVHMHGADFFAFHDALPRWQQLLIGAILRRATHVVVLGSVWRDFLASRLRVDPARISVVLNGVSFPSPYPRARQKTATLRILFLGRVGDRKGVPELLQALALPRLQRLNWIATIAGDGEIARFREMTAGLDLAGRVALPGWVARNHAAALLREADLLVLPSHDEALPIAIVEALAHRVAVIATPVGVLPELLQDGVHALLVPPGNVPMLARAIARLIEEPDLRKAIAERGHQLFLERLDIRNTASQLMQLYGETIAQGARFKPADAQPAIMSTQTSLSERLDHV